MCSDNLFDYQRGVIILPRFGMFGYSCLLWTINMILIVLSYFVTGIVYAAPFLMIAIFIAFFMMIVTARKEHTDLKHILKTSAGWTKIIAFVSIAYTLVNFAVCMILLREGGPHIDNGVYCLWNHGFIREITKHEYDSLMRVRGRLSTGHMLIFAALPIVFFSSQKQKNTSKS